jgi:hypothetical protein
LIPVNDRGPYTTAEKPKMSEITKTALPPNCYGLPYGNHGLHPENTKYPFAPGGNYQLGGLTGSSPPAAASSKPTTPGAPGSTAGVGSPTEQQQISTILNQIAGGHSNAGGLDDLLVGPLLRGMAVTP